jgi:hypothetical protein
MNNEMMKNMVFMLILFRRMSIAKTSDRTSSW